MELNTEQKKNIFSLQGLDSGDVKMFMFKHDSDPKDIHQEPIYEFVVIVQSKSKLKSDLTRSVCKD